MMILRIFIVTLFILAVGCAPRPTIVTGPLPSGITETLLQRLEVNASAFRSVKGLAKVKVSASGKTMRATQVIMAEKPENLRAEILSPFGQALMIFASNGTELKALLPGSGEFYQGDASAANLARFTHIPFDVADLVSLLLYQVPVIVHGATSVTREDDGGYQLVMEGEGEFRQQFRFNKDLQLTQALYVQAGQTVLRVDYSDFSESQNFYPLKTSIEVPGSETEAQLSFSQVTTNVSIPADRFVLEPPAGAVIKELP